jgi:opacity protein-like surface antigen
MSLRIRVPMRTWFGVVALALTAAGRPLRAQHAQQPESDVERNARLARRGAGLHVGTWDVRGLSEPDGVSTSSMPLVDGYFRKGLDQHLALETTVGLWRRTQTVRQSGGVLGGGGEDRVTSYIVPQFTSLMLFPFTQPSQRVEPYLSGGAGLALGIDDRQTTAGGLFGGESGTAMTAGFGFQTGTGVEWRLSKAFGLTAGARYQWIRFLQDLGGDRTFRGFGLDGGVTYRFQY